MSKVDNDPRKVIVRESEKGRFTREIVIGNHILTADEPIENGGNDLGPSPYDFLLAGLGACTSMTLRFYADLKKIPLVKVIVRLTHNRIYSKDCADCQNSHSKIDHIQRIIELQGDLNQQQREELLDIANKCPVHRTLISKILITTNLVE